MKRAHRAIVFMQYLVPVRVIECPPLGICHLIACDIDGYAIAKWLLALT